MRADGKSSHVEVDRTRFEKMEAVVSAARALGGPHGCGHSLKMAPFRLQAALDDLDGIDRGWADSLGETTVLTAFPLDGDFSAPAGSEDDWSIMSNTMDPSDPAYGGEEGRGW